MKQALGWGEGSDKVEQDFAQRGEMGLDGFLRFVGYFVEYHGLLGTLIETTIAIDPDNESETEELENQQVTYTPSRPREICPRRNPQAQLT